MTSESQEGTTAPKAEDAGTRRISPPLADLSSLRQPLTDGELEVAEFFNRLLPLEWEIYLQPHLNGLRPDVVLLNPKVGVALFEVKDWDLTRAMYRQPAGKDDGYAVIPAGKGFWCSKRDPLRQVRGYEAELSSIYLPSLGAEPKNFAALSAGVIFTRATGAEARDFLASVLAGQPQEFLDHHPISGRDSLEKGNLQAVFPEGLRSRSKIMSEDLAEDLRRWLRESESSREQRTPLKLDAQQRALASERTESGFRRIRGPAGSGKSAILAQRAAHLQREKKDVLIVYFNHTLRPYLWDLMSRAGGDPRAVTWLGFHDWCKRSMRMAGRGGRHTELWEQDEGPLTVKEREHILGVEMAQETIRALSDGPTADEVPRFDAILVDEGQDFLPEWWEALRGVLRDGGEMLLLSDLSQDIYGQGRTWTEDVMRGAGFSGPWNTLTRSYRMPEELTTLVAKFREMFLQGNGGVAPVPGERQEVLPFVNLRWRQVRRNQEVQAVISELDEVVKDATYSDVGIMTSTQDQVFAVEKALARKGIKCQTTVDKDWRKAREKKMFFFKGGSRVKVTTIHSFKGWEMSRIILILAGSPVGDGPSLAYSGLSRLSSSEAGSSLSVVASVPEFEEFGRMWPTFIPDQRT